MQAASKLLPQALMQSPATWAPGSVATGVRVPSTYSSSRLSNSLAADSQLLRGLLRLQPCRLPPWSSQRLPRLGNSLRVSGLGVDGGNSDTAPSHGTQVSSSSQPRSSSIVEVDEEPGITEDELGVLSKLIDEQLLQILQNPGEPEEPVRQTVLMTDGTDSRPYRLLWPAPSVIFHISPGPAFTATSGKHIESGVKLPRSCLLQHVSVDFVHEEWGDDFVENLHGKGYRGDCPSVWALEMPGATLSEVSLRGIFAVASSVLMKGSKFLGVISSPWSGSSELESRALLRRLCADHGFTFKVLPYEELISSSHSGVSKSSAPNLPLAFIAEQLRLSDAQVDHAHMLMAMAEEADEDTFEDSF